MTDDERLLSVGEFYANDFGPANLDLLAAFFKKYPDYVDKTFLSVKVTQSLAFNTLVAG